MEYISINTTIRCL